jgi:hypothetical protein
MTTMNNQPKAKQGMQFPSHVTAPCADETVCGLAREIVDTSRDQNNVLATGEVHFFVRGHYVDTATGTFGIESLIRNILRANNAIFPAGAEKTELRAIVIAGAKFTDEIIAAVRETFGADRYPDGTIRMYLSKFGKQFGKVKLSNSEDSNRPCPKPRCKWYVAE